MHLFDLRQTRALLHFLAVSRLARASCSWAAFAADCSASSRAFDSLSTSASARARDSDASYAACSARAR
jgi:hypothetical protein